MQGAEICSIEPGSTKSDDLVSETRWSEISSSSSNSGETTTVEPDDWRTPMIHYLENSGHIADRKVW
jgi:hypothetical protein